MEQLDANEMQHALQFMDAIAFSRDMDTLLRNAVEFIVQSVRASNGAAIIDGKTTRFYSNPASDPIYIGVESAIRPHVLKSNSAAVIRSLTQESLVAHVSGLDRIAPSLLAVPIPGADGVMFLYSEKDLRHKLAMLGVILPRLAKAIKSVKDYESVQRTALTDALTGLYNRMCLNVALQQELERARELRRPTSVLIFDVDNFKQYNDTKGHLDGDHVLQQVAHVAREHCAPQDIACRFGGEEFVLILPECSPDSGKARAESLREEVQRQCPLTISIGLVTCLNSSADPQTMLKEADRALYKAKASGKNCTVPFLIIDKSLKTVDVDADALIRK